MIRNFLTTKKFFISLGGLVLIGLVLWLAFSGGLGKKAEKAAKEKHEALKTGEVKLDPEAMNRGDIKVAEVVQGPMVNKILFTGELGFSEDKMARVSSRIAGRIDKVVADFGSTVQKGSVLAVIDSVELGQAQAAFLQAVAAYNVAQQAYERALLLWQQQAFSKAEFLDRKSKFELAQAERNYAENRLHLLGLSDVDIARMLRGGKKRQGPGFHAAVDSTFHLRSPIPGEVVDRKATPGLVVQPNEVLFTVADPASLWCYVQVPEKGLSRVKAGFPVTITASSLPQEEFGGAIDYIAATVDKATRMTQARVKVDNPKGRLKAGMFVDIQVTAGTRPALTVPESAIAATGSEQYVFIEEAPGLFMKRTIKSGLKDNGRVEIIEGLKAGEKVAVQGVFTLKSELEKESLEAE